MAGTTAAEKQGNTGPGEVIELVQGYRKNALHIDSANYVLLGNYINIYNTQYQLSVTHKKSYFCTLMT